MSSSTSPPPPSPGGEEDAKSSLHAPLLIKPVPGPAEPDKICIDGMLQKYCGDFGPWQLRHFVLTSLAWALEAFHAMVMIFADREPGWVCTGPGCDRSATSFCGFEPGSWKWTEGVHSSTVSEWGLVCGEKYKVGLVQALFFGGCMIGAGIFGHLSDSFLGRKGSLTAVCLLNSIFGFLTAFSPGYWIYCILRFLTGFSTGGVGLCAFVLATEPVGPAKRGVAGMSTFYFFSVGIALLSGIAYVFQSWRALYITSSLPSMLFLTCVLPFVYESPRWYLVRGRINEAMKIMHLIAKSNGNRIPDGLILALDEDVNNNSSSESKTPKEKTETKDVISGSLMDVVRTPLTRIRLILAVGINFLCSVVYYGISLNVVNLKTNLYLNVLLNAVAEMPAFLITAVLLDKYGRKPLAIGTQWFSGFFCLVGSVVPPIGVWKVVRMACGILGIFGTAGTYNLLFIYTAELFPTVVRNAALGCATQAAQMGAILAPFVVVLGGWLPFAVFAVCAIWGGILGFFLPETLNRPLYDTMAGMEGGENGHGGF